jgi:hypothetical protein
MACSEANLIHHLLIRYEIKIHISLVALKDQKLRGPD